MLMSPFIDSHLRKRFIPKSDQIRRFQAMLQCIWLRPGDPQFADDFQTCVILLASAAVVNHGDVRDWQEHEDGQRAFKIRWLITWKASSTWPLGLLSYATLGKSFTCLDWTSWVPSNFPTLLTLPKCRAWLGCGRLCCALQPLCLLWGMLRRCSLDLSC